MQFSDQKKGMLMAFTAVMFLTPDSLFIRLANVSSWNLIFYRGFIPFSLVFIGLLMVYKNNLIKLYILRKIDLFCFFSYLRFCVF